MATKKTKPLSHYIDNKVFYDAIMEHKAKCELAKAEGKEAPQLSNYLGECFIKIATHLSYSPNFINYTYRDEMIADGIENCVWAAEKFDPAKSSNPFAYFTQITFYAFVRRIQTEKKQQQTKFNLISQTDIETMVTQAHDAGEYGNELLEYLRLQLDQKSVPQQQTKQKTKQIEANELEFD